MKKKDMAGNTQDIHCQGLFKTTEDVQRKSGNQPGHVQEIVLYFANDDKHYKERTLDVVIGQVNDNNILSPDVVAVYTMLRICCSNCEEQAKK